MHQSEGALPYRQNFNIIQKSYDQWR